MKMTVVRIPIGCEEWWFSRKHLSGTGSIIFIVIVYVKYSTYFTVIYSYHLISNHPNIFKPSQCKYHMDHARMDRVIKTAIQPTDAHKICPNLSKQAGKAAGIGQRDDYRNSTRFMQFWRMSHRKNRTLYKILNLNIYIYIHLDRKRNMEPASTVSCGFPPKTSQDNIQENPLIPRLQAVNNQILLFFVQALKRGHKHWMTLNLGWLHTRFFQQQTEVQLSVS